LEELKKKTTFSEKEIREWYAGFMHDCPDGELDKKTFTRIFKQFYLHDDNKADSFCNYVFEMFDEDGNKTMSFKEFLLAICPSTQGELKKRLELVFDMYNVSGDTDIDEEELASFIVIMYDLVGETNRTGDRDPNKLAMKIIGTLDKNGDGKLSRTEFIAEMRHQLADKGTFPGAGALFSWDSVHLLAHSDRAFLLLQL
ncbi:unnamed protein product, partial [Rotaria sp. Silwood1]